MTLIRSTSSLSERFVQYCSKLDPVNYMLCFLDNERSASGLRRKSSVDAATLQSPAGQESLEGPNPSTEGPNPFMCPAGELDPVPEEGPETRPPTPPPTPSERTPLLLTRRRSSLTPSPVFPKRRRRDMPDERDEDTFSIRELFAYAGPGLLVGVGFADLGSIAADIESGSLAQYKLLWVMLWSAVAGMVLQRLAVRLGAVTGLDLAQHCRRRYPRPVSLLLWLLVELAIVGNNVLGVIGSAMAYNLLSNQRIHVWQGVLLTISSSLLFLMLGKFGWRVLEMLFGMFLFVILLTFGYAMGVAAPDQDAMARGALLPTCEDCGWRPRLQILVLVSAALAPHNLYLHSALVKARNVDRSRPRGVRDANIYFVTESGFAVLLAFIINMFVMSTFASALRGVTNEQARSMCVATANASGLPIVFENNTHPVKANIYHGGIFLGCKFGVTAMYAWAVGLLVAGQAVTTAGCYASQSVMEGFLGLRWSRWRRLLAARLTAVLPALWVARYGSPDQLDGLARLVQRAGSLQLPFALLPLVAATGSQAVMGQFANSVPSTVVALVLSAGFVAASSLSAEYAFPPGAGWVVASTLLLMAYFGLIAFLVLHLLLSVGLFPALARSPFVRRFVLCDEEDDEDEDHVGGLGGAPPPTLPVSTDWPTIEDLEGGDQLSSCSTCSLAGRRRSNGPITAL